MFPLEEQYVVHLEMNSPFFVFLFLFLSLELFFWARQSLFRFVFYKESKLNNYSYWVGELSPENMLWRNSSKRWGKEYTCLISFSHLCLLGCYGSSLNVKPGCSSALQGERDHLVWGYGNKLGDASKNAVSNRKTKFYLDN